MGDMSIWHWIVILLWAIGFQWPAWRIVAKAGYHGALSLLILIPVVGMLAFWVFAFRRWPVEKAA